jgi:hypothetical protein
MSAGQESANPGEWPKELLDRAAPVADTLRRYLASGESRLASDWLNKLTAELAMRLNDPPNRGVANLYMANVRAAQITVWVADGLEIPDDSVGSFVRDQRKKRSNLEEKKHWSISQDTWDLDRATVVNLVGELTRHVGEPTDTGTAPAHIDRLKLLVIVLVVLGFAGAPVGELRLPPELQSVLANEAAYLALAVAIATAIHNYRKPPDK